MTMAKEKPSPGDTETLTIRLPKQLKVTLDQAARTRATTVTALVRQSLEESLLPVARTYQHPGFSVDFQTFIERVGQRQRPVIILVVDERTGQRFYFQGRVDLTLTNSSLLAIKRRGELPWIIPRRDVVAWFEGDSTDLNDLSVSLSHQGWAARTGY